MCNLNRGLSRSRQTACAAVGEQRVSAHLANAAAATH